MTRKELYDIRKNWILKNHKYSMVNVNDYDYSILKNIMYLTRSGKYHDETYNDVVIMIDTETSKLHPNAYTEVIKMGRTLKKVIPVKNYVVAWTISIRAFGININTIYGRKPSSLVECIKKIHETMIGSRTVFYCHNFSYDYVFIRKFLFREFGFPCKQLNTKSHYPILMEFNNGIIFKDSLILFQRSLEKTAKDLNVEHQKSVGKWDYLKIRTQDESEEFTIDELEYIEHDTLAGVECIDKYREQLGKEIHTMPYTATGIPRERVRKLAKENNFRNKFLKMVPTYDQYILATRVYHGGFTHGYRGEIDMTIRATLIDGVWQDLIQSADFSSSYPYNMLTTLVPVEGFRECESTVEDILQLQNELAYMFRFTSINIRLKNDDVVMPCLQFSKCTNTLDCILDNGRVLSAKLVSIYLCELDLDLINKYYEWDNAVVTECQCAAKGYLPRWFTDYVFDCYKDKTMLKGSGDPVAYALAKSIANSLYGMCAQRSIRENLIEDFDTGEYIVDKSISNEELYEKYVNNRNNILVYTWSIWITAGAMHNLFELGECCDNWLYSDTDSCYGQGWHWDKVEEYNNKCKQKLIDNGYGPVLHNGREYWLGIAEHEDGVDDYTEFRYLGAKRYCYRQLEDGQLHITVAGVPKKGVECLHDDISNFTVGMVFDGETTGKLMHSYIYVDYIEYIDGLEIGDSIDLNPCDYLLDSVQVYDWDMIIENIMSDDVEVEYYE